MLREASHEFLVSPRLRGLTIFKELAKKIITNTPREEVNKLNGVELLSLARKIQTVQLSFVAADDC